MLTRYPLKMPNVRIRGITMNMKKNLIMYLVSIIVVCLVLGAIFMDVFFVRNTNKAILNIEEKMQDKVSEKLKEYNNVSASFNKEVEDAGKSSVKSIADQFFDEDQKSFRMMTGEELQEVSQKHDVQHAFIMDGNGNISCSTDGAQQNFFMAHPELIKEFQKSLGKGSSQIVNTEDFRHDGRFDRYCAYSPTNSNQYVVARMNFKEYVRSRYPENCYNCLFEDYSRDFFLSGQNLKQLDVFCMFDGQGWSIINESKKASFKKDVLKRLQQDGKCIDKHGTQAVFYRKISIKGDTVPKDGQLFIVAEYDLSGMRANLVHCILYYLMATSVTTVAIFLVTWRFTNRNIFRKVKNINDQLRRMSYGDYSNALECEGDDEFSQICRCIEDTKRKIQLRELELRYTEDRYRMLIDIMPDPLFIRNREKILFANHEGICLLGETSMQDITSKKMSDLMEVIPECQKRKEEIIREFLETGEVKYARNVFRRKKDGKILYLETSAKRLDDERWIIISRDMSTVHQAEELKKNMEEKTRLLNETLEYDRLKTEFFANISHELRTPLNVICSAIQMNDFLLSKMSIEQDKEALKKYSKIMKQNSYRLIRLINNLIDITKLDAGYFKLERVNCDMVNVVEEIALSVADYIETKGISLIFDTDVEEKVMAFDPDKIERIMLNLLSNAVKFTDPGGCIYVNIYDKKDEVQISVRDTGIGIPADKREAIFKRFIQVDKSLSRNQEGSGIGLSLVKSLANLHGGDITLKSQVGKGSEFTVVIPVEIIPEDECAACKEFTKYDNIERINVEFSDIYFYNKSSKD